MKKKIAGAILAALLLRGAVIAGAGEAIGTWIREHTGVSSVSATLNFNLTGEPEEAPQAPAETPQASAPELSFLRVEVPAPTDPPAEEQPAPETPEVKVLAAELGGGGARIHNRTALTPDFDALAAEPLSQTLTAGEPQILILHTHSSEAYTPAGNDIYTASDPYRTEEKEYSVIRVGDVLAEKLESFGLQVIHDREIYDYPSYTGSYGRSGAAAEAYLAQYPSICIVIDLHRDALGDNDVVYKTDAHIDGKTSAQVMMVIGTGENGLWHPNWKENLKLAMYLQNASDARYPSLARPIELVSERYNQQLSSGMMILEVGSNGNTLREAVAAVTLFGEATGPALAKLVKTPD